MDIEDFQQASGDLWFTCMYVAFPQFSSFIAASVGTAFISMAELDRLGLGPLFHVLVDVLKNKGPLARHHHMKDHQ